MQLRKGVSAGAAGLAASWLMLHRQLPVMGRRGPMADVTAQLLRRIQPRTLNVWHRVCHAQDSTMVLQLAAGCMPYLCAERLFVVGTGGLSMRSSWSHESPTNHSTDSHIVVMPNT